MSKQIDAARTRAGTRAEGTSMPPPVDLPSDSDLGLAEFLRRMVDAGWRLAAPETTAPDSVSVCFVAHPPDDGGAHLVYGYGTVTTISVEDLWRIATDARASACEHAVMVLAPLVTLSGPIRDTAARLNVRILRLAA